ncbi:glycosyltransferase family 4 protein [Rossellomorea marisflavi]|uniref:glycosyltransferase family 4 protein n=1 Tax=Rossellomorea marisflavi TaxID=189381 RepID=UPI003AEB2928
MREKKDVLFLCQYFYPEYISSATLPYDTAKALVKSGLKVDTICGYPKEYNKSNDVPLKEHLNGINIRRLKYLQLGRASFIGRLINYFSFTFVSLLHIRKMKSYKVIIVYSNPPVLPLIAAWAKKLFNTKIVFVSYDVYPEIAYRTNSISEDSFISKMMNKVNATVFKHVDKVVALSSEMKRFLLKNRDGINNDSVEVIPNWYEDKGLVNSTISNESKFFSFKNDGDVVISYFGNMGTSQDLATLLNAIRALSGDSRIKFLFAGHGNKMDSLRNSIKRENLHNVTVYDFLHGDDYQDALRTSDCFVVTLEDGLTGLAVPSKTYAYMMAGKPIISIMGTHSDISEDLKQNYAGYAVEVGDELSLVKAIEELRDNPIQRGEMGRNARDLYLKKYTTEICTNQYVKMIKNLLGD